ncbi:hypothetical protein [Crossiella sp. NPDC003009]
MPEPAPPLADRLVGRDHQGWTAELHADFRRNEHNGRGRRHSHDGATREVTYRSGESKFLRFPAGHFLLHDLENIGRTPLLFITTEFLDSPNPPLPL